jgi:hypothetical protein
MEKGLLNNDDIELANWARALDRDKLPQDVSNYLKFGENEIKKFGNETKIKRTGHDSMISYIFGGK